MSTPTTTIPEPALRDLLERRLLAAEASRDEDLRAVEEKHAKEILKLEVQLAAEDDITPTELRRRRRKERAEAKAVAEKAKEPAGEQPTAEPSPARPADEEAPGRELESDEIPTRESPEVVAQRRAQADTTPESVVARIGQIITRIDIELYSDALPADLRKHPDVVTAFARRLSGFGRKAS